MPRFRIDGITDDQGQTFSGLSGLQEEHNRYEEEQRGGRNLSGGRTLFMPGKADMWNPLGCPMYTNSILVIFRGN